MPIRHYETGTGTVTLEAKNHGDTYYVLVVVHFLALKNVVTVSKAYRTASFEIACDKVEKSTVEDARKVVTALSEPIQFSRSLDIALEKAKRLKDPELTKGQLELKARLSRNKT